MKNFYDENRMNDILKTLSTEKLLCETELYKNEELPAFVSFSDALIRTIMVREHADHLNIRNLSYYLRDQAEHMGLSNDRDISYTVDQIERLSKKIRALKRGAAGEAQANRAMFGINAPNRILKNLEFTVDGMYFELDTIVINQSGVCVVEVKNFQRDLLIDETGNLVAVDDPDVTYFNIRTKLNNGAAVVRRIIENAFPGNEKFLAMTEKIPVVLLSTGGQITDVCDEFTITDCDNIAAILNHLPCSQPLTRNEIIELACAIEKASETRKYPIHYDYVRVAKAFAIAVAKLEYASDLEDTELGAVDPAVDEAADAADELDHDKGVAETEEMGVKSQERPKKNKYSWIITVLGIVALGAACLFMGGDDY